LQLAALNDADLEKLSIKNLKVSITKEKKTIL
jgi:hypothetical protein